MSAAYLLTRAHRAVQAFTGAGAERLSAGHDVQRRESPRADSNPDGASVSESASGDTAPTPQSEGRAVASEGEEDGALSVATAEGHIDMCDREPYSSVLRIGGWALLPGAMVSRVDVLLDGRSVGSARLGLPREDLAQVFPSAQAPVCGFILLLDMSDLSNQGEVTISALAYGTDGSSTRLPEVRVWIASRELPFDDHGGRAAQLRERAQRGVVARERLDEPLSVLVFTHDLRLGGAQLYLAEILDRIISGSDWSCTLVTPEDGPVRTRLEEAGISVHVTPDYGLLGVETYEGKMAELLAWASVQGFDVVLANSLIGFIGVDLASRLGIPAIFMVHESMETPRWSVDTHRWLTPHRYVRERMEQALGAASAVVFEAEATRRQYTHLGDPHRFRAMPYAVELDQIARRGESFDGSTLRRRLGIPEATTVVLCLGTFEPRKAQSSIVQAFSLVAEQHPDAWLCLVGDLGDSYSGAVREYVTRAGLWPRVVIRPMVDDPYEWLGVADVLVLASDIESLPRVVLEAMALGTPVVSTGVFGLADLIDDGRTGILCEPRDIGALAGALERALSATPEERRRITDAASSMVRRNHKPEGYARDFVRLIEEALEQHDSPRPQRGRNVMSPARTHGL